MLEKAEREEIRKLRKRLDREEKKVDRIENNELVHLDQRIKRLERISINLIASYAGITGGFILGVLAVLTGVWQFGYLGICLTLISILHLVNIRIRRKENAKPKYQNSK